MSLTGSLVTAEVAPRRGRPRGSPWWIGVGWTGGAVLSSRIGLPGALVAMTLLIVPAVPLAWISPLRRIHG